MIELFLKLIELYIGRRDKFKKAGERLIRREQFFKDIDAIDSNTLIDEDRKRAMKNSLAQIITGSGLVTYELVDYYYRNPHFINFERIAGIVGFWDEVLIKEYDEDRRIIKLRLNRKKFIFEKTLLGMSVFFTFCFTVFALVGSKELNYFFVNTFYLNQNLVGIILVITCLSLMVFTISLLIMFLALCDLKRLVK
ncbi:hypothetical protein J559_0891 [Acinetobacter sp. 983759]|uniref:hypothetical protein n=1 Tax=Acinetobacter sp. 983759 TaxID=1310660 RepID=UPI00044CEDEF|nr:hypothetical protein [Acinetobacter sp. 983759]EXE15319.1 hypothetical protein J559_0891 [Acinetobacter sp. 983759]